MGVNQEFMEIQLNQHRCRKKTFQSPRGCSKNFQKSDKFLDPIIFVFQKKIEGLNV